MKNYTREQIKALYEKENNLKRLVYRSACICYQESDFAHKVFIKESSYDENVVAEMVVKAMGLKKGYFKEGYFYNTTKYLNTLEQINKLIMELASEGFLNIEQSAHPLYSYITVK